MNVEPKHALILKAIAEQLQNLNSLSSEERWSRPVRERADIDLAREHHVVRSDMRWLCGVDGNKAERMTHGRSLNRMESAGLIERFTARYVRLTDAGRKALDAGNELISRFPTFCTKPTGSNRSQVFPAFEDRDELGARAGIYRHRADVSEAEKGCRKV